MPDNENNDRNSAPIALNKVAQKCTHLNADEQALYQQMLAWQIETDKQLGIKSQFVRQDNGRIIYDRDATGQPPLDAFRGQSLEKTQCGIMGLNYSMALRNLVSLSDHDQSFKDTFCEELSGYEGAYIAKSKTLEPNESPELLRQSFIRDTLAKLMVHKGVKIAGKSVTSLRVAIKVLDNAKNWTGLAMTPYAIRTRGKIKKSNTTIAEYARLAEPIYQISDELKAEFQACATDAKPVWFTCLSPIDQALVISYLPNLERGCVIPSQLRSKIPGMKNAFVTKTTVNGEEVSVNACAASSTPVIDKLPDDETKRLTKLTVENLKEALGCEHLTIGTLVSDQGDNTLKIVDEMGSSIPGQYYDARTAHMTQSTQSNSVSAFNVCLNNFRYGESDNISAFEKQAEQIQATLDLLSSAPPSLQKKIQAIHNQSEAILNVSASMNGRLQTADTIIKKNLVFVELIRFFVKTKLSGVRKEVRKSISDELLDRFAATKINAKKNKHALDKLDGELKGIELIWRYTKCSNAVSALKADANQLSDADQRILEGLPSTGLVFGCMSGENRTQHVNHLVASLSIVEKLSAQDDALDDKLTLQAVVKSTTDDFHAQLMTGIYGGMPGSIGLRSKSKDSTSTKYYAGNQDAARTMHLSFADAKSMNQTLVPMRMWMMECRKHPYDLSVVAPHFHDFLNKVNASMTEGLTLLNESDINPEELSQSFKKQYKAMQADCGKDGPFRGTPIASHPDWRPFVEALSTKKRLNTYEKSAQTHLDKLEPGLRNMLPPVPKVTKAIAIRDEVIRKIDAKLYYLSLANQTNRSLKFSIDSLKKHLKVLKTEYQKNRFSNVETLQAAIGLPLIQCLNTWKSINGSKEAYRVFVPLSFELGYDVDTPKHKPLFPGLACKRMMKWVQKSGRVFDAASKAGATESKGSDFSDHEKPGLMTTEESDFVVITKNRHAKINRAVSSDDPPPEFLDALAARRARSSSEPGLTSAKRRSRTPDFLVEGKARARSRPYSEESLGEGIRALMPSSEETLIGLAQQIKRRVVARYQHKAAKKSYHTLIDAIDGFLTNPNRDSVNEFYYALIHSSYIPNQSHILIQEFAKQAGAFYGDARLAEAGTKDISVLRRFMKYVKENPGKTAIATAAGIAGIAVGGPLAALLAAKAVLATKAALAAKVAIDLAAAGAAATAASKASKKTQSWRESHSWSDPLKAILQKIAQCFYNKPILDLNSIFTSMGRKISSFFRSTTPTVSPENPDTTSVRGVGPDHPPYNSGHPINMVLPEPESGFEAGQSKTISFGIRNSKLSYVNIPTGDMHTQHIASSLKSLAEAGHTVITLTGTLSQTFKDTLQVLNNERDQPLKIVDNTDNRLEETSGNLPSL